MLNTFLDLFMSMIKMLKYPIYILIFVIGLNIILVSINLVIFRIRGFKIKKGTRVRQKRKSILKRLIIDAPKQFALDLVTAEPDFFRHQGLIIYTGRQGRGKSIGIVEHALRMQKEYPRAKCISNIAYKYQDDNIKHWKQLVKIKNGIYGLIVILDELQNWFSSNQSRTFPPEMLGVITQNRKNRRIILGTAQSFHLLAKSIRSQATEVRECFTVAGVITFIRRREPILDSDGDVKEWKNRGFYFF
ncbi:MAG: zonular occludens toxin domain-containing protein, partial [Sulfolobaceae archaeon]